MSRKTVTERKSQINKLLLKESPLSVPQVASRIRLGMDRTREIMRAMVSSGTLAAVGGSGMKNDPLVYAVNVTSPTPPAKRAVVRAPTPPQQVQPQADRREEMSVTMLTAASTLLTQRVEEKGSVTLDAADPLFLMIKGATQGVEQARA